MPGTGQPGPVDARWSAVFAACAGPLIAALQPRQRGLQKAFRRHHREQITALDGQAAHFVTAMRQRLVRKTAA